jgi:hypothetical protein
MQYKKLLAMVVAALAISGLLLPLTVSAAGWSAPFPLGTGYYKPAVGIGTDGSVHYIWANPTNWVIQYVKCGNLNQNSCGSTETLSSPGAAYYPTIAMDANNNPNVAFESKDNTGNVYSVYYTKRSNGGWSNPSRVSNEPRSEVPDIAIGGDGGINIIYQSKDASGNGSIYYVRGTSSGQFQTPTLLQQVKSDTPLPTLAEVGLYGENAGGKAPTGNNLAAGFYPRIAADKAGNAYAVWQELATTGYGIDFTYQTGGSNWSRIQKIGGNHKDQTPDVAVNANNSVGIVWAMYDTALNSISLAEFDNGVQDFIQLNVDGGLDNSFFPKVAADCQGTFHFVYEGRNLGNSYDIFHATYNPSNNQIGGRETIANSNYGEETPAIAVTNVAAIVYNNSGAKITDASTNNLNLTCGTPSPTNTPTATSTTNPNITPTPTTTPGGQIWVPNTSSSITYKKGWKKYSNSKATDGNYTRCETGGICVRGSGAKIVVPDGYTRVQVYTARALTYGRMNIWINDGVDNNNKPSASFDMCTAGLTPKFITGAKYTFTVPPRSDHLPRTLEIGGSGKHTTCSPYDTSYVSVDGFMILP